MSRDQVRRLDDILAAGEAIQSHLAHGGLDDELVFDAVRVRLIEIGEAVKGLDSESRVSEPDIRWAAAARMRDRLAHRYYDTEVAIVEATISNDLPQLLAGVRRLRVAADG